MTKRKSSEKAAEVNRRIRRQNRGTGVDGADWGEADSGLVLQAVTAIAKHGFAVQFGYTRDQSTFVIRIVGDGEPFNEYVRPTEDVDTYLRGLISDYEQEQT